MRPISRAVNGILRCRVEKRLPGSRRLALKFWLRSFALTVFVVRRLRGQNMSPSKQLPRYLRHMQGGTTEAPRAKVPRCDRFPYPSSAPIVVNLSVATVCRNMAEVTMCDVGKAVHLRSTNELERGLRTELHVPWSTQDFEWDSGALRASSKASSRVHEAETERGQELGTRSRNQCRVAGCNTSLSLQKFYYQARPLAGLPWDPEGVRGNGGSRTPPAVQPSHLVPHVHTCPAEVHDMSVPRCRRQHHHRRGRQQVLSAGEVLAGRCLLPMKAQASH